MTQDPHPTAAIVPAGKILCYITGILRKETSEEHVRQRVARALVQEYGYAKSDIGVEFPVRLGRARKRVDLAVFEASSVHAQENITLIVEAKNEDMKRSDPEEGLDQLHSYMAACPNAEWGLWVGQEITAVRKVISRGRIRFVEEPDIPPVGRSRPPRLRYSDLVPAESLKPVFRRVHNYIYANEGLQKAEAFQELLKLIFCKVLDEDSAVGELQFDVDEEERLSTLGQRRLRTRMDGLFAAVIKTYPHIFDRLDAIKLNDRVLAYVVSELRRYSLLRTRADVKGEAYQELVRDNLRGDRGEFFTPDVVCRMAVQMCFEMFDRQQWQHLRILDPACGTGGFLRSAMNVLRQHFEERERGKGDRGEVVDLKVAASLRAACERNLFGFDINPLLVRTTQMNLVMHGDGSSNVFHANSLLPPGEWQQVPGGPEMIGSMDIVVTNPPFGTGPGLVIDDLHVLEQFTLPLAGVARPRRRVPPDHLFIERCGDFLKPGGVLAIVLPDSILSNPGLRYIREWILDRYRVIASIDLPLETFVAFADTGTQTSVLILQKLSPAERRVRRIASVLPEYDVFMAVPKTMGYDRRGNDLWLRTNDGAVEWVDISEVLPDGRVRVTPRKVRDDEVSEVAAIFGDWYRRYSNVGEE